MAQTSVCAHRPGANRQLARRSRRTNPTIPSRAGLTRPIPSIFAGRNNRAELRSLSSASCHRRSNSSPHHPGVSVAQPLLSALIFEAAGLVLVAQPILAVLFFLPVGTIGPRLYFFELLPRSCSGRSLDRLFYPKASEHRTRTRPDSSPGRSTEVTRTFTTPESFCRGNQRPERFALPFELQQLARLAGLEPATVVRSSSCLHHSANYCSGNH